MYNEAGTYNLTFNPVRKEWQPVKVGMVTPDPVKYKIDSYDKQRET
jgi:hypothetical protein